MEINQTKHTIDSQNTATTNNYIAIYYIILQDIHHI